MANVSLPFYKKIEVKSLQCVCYIYGYVLNTQCWELNLVQKLMTIILGIEHTTNKVGIIFSNYKQFLKNKTEPKVVTDWKKKYHFTLSLFLVKQWYHLNLKTSHT